MLAAAQHGNAQRPTTVDLSLFSRVCVLSARQVRGPQEAPRARAGALPTHGPLFVGLLIGIVLAIGALTYLSALALGPITEAVRTLAPAVH
jgi:K+-transporting ATPase A subunit